MEILKVIRTALLSAAVLFVIAKLLGHKQVAQFDFFDYINGITIGSIAAELSTNLEAPWKPLIALVVYGTVSILLTLLTRNFPKTRKYVNGTPTILLDKGTIYRSNLKKSKLDLSEFLLLCREQGYFDLNEIQTAVFEPNGKLSVLPKAEKRPLTPADMTITPDPVQIGTEIIMDGRLMEENLVRIGRDENWLEKQLAAQGYKNAEEILLGIYTATEDHLTIYPLV